MKIFDRYLALFVIVAAIGLGCRSCDTIESNKLVQSEIYQDYDITADGDNVGVSATFRVSGSTGTTIALVSPAKIEYNGSAMSENLRTALQGTYYSSGSKTFVENHEFVYTNGDGQTFRNSISFQKIEPKGGPFNIVIGKQIEIPLSRPLAAGESIEASLESDEPTPTNTSNGNSDKSGGPTYSLTFDNLNGSRDALLIDDNALKNFPPGKARLRIKVRRSEPLKQATNIGGMIGYEYRSSTEKVLVIR